MDRDECARRFLRALKFIYSREITGKHLIGKWFSNLWNIHIVIYYANIKMCMIEKYLLMY